MKVLLSALLIVFWGSAVHGRDPLQLQSGVAQSVPALTGRLLDAQGKPLANMQVSVSIRGKRGILGDWWQTDSLGRFQFTPKSENAGMETWIGIHAAFTSRQMASGAWSQLPQGVFVCPADASPPIDVGDLRLDEQSFVARLNDEQAQTLLRRWCSGDRCHNRQRDWLEAILADVLHRPKEYWIPVLESLWQYKLDADDPRYTEAGLGDLEMLTVLRRLQGKPDPLRVEFEPAGSLTALSPGSLSFQVSFVNRDVNSAVFQVQSGGDYRSGRLERWRVELTDAAGKVVPPSRFYSGIGGGMAWMRNLGPGESFPAALTLLHYCAPLIPGEYQMRVFYHDSQSIASLTNNDGLIVASSAPQSLRVTPRHIELTRQERAQLQEQFEALDPNAPVLVLDAGSAGMQAIVDEPKSPEERLLIAGWKAVPILLAALEDASRSTLRHAWALALLYDITGLEDPRLEQGALGRYEVFIASRSLGPNGPIVLGGGSGQGRGGAPRAESQARLIEFWRAMARMIEIHEH
jgi:hypothetical protein